MSCLDVHYRFEAPLSFAPSSPARAGGNHHIDVFLVVVLDAEANNAIKKALEHRSFTALQNVLLQKALEEARKTKPAKRR